MNQSPPWQRRLRACHRHSLVPWSAGLVPEEPVVDLLNGSMFMKTAPACPPPPRPRPWAAVMDATPPTS